MPPPARLGQGGAQSGGSPGYAGATQLLIRKEGCVVVIKDYKVRKEQGMVQLLKIGQGAAFAQRRFDPATGKELEPEIVSINLELLRKQRDEVAANLASLDEFIADVEAVILGEPFGFAQGDVS